jgi:hypothetical protein
MFGIVKRMAVNKEELSDVESWLVGQSLRFAAEITGQFKEVPQVLAATEGLSFFLHALRREVFKPSEFKAWDGIFEPAIKQMIQLFAMTVSAWSGADIDRATLAKDVQNMISMRNLEYQTVPFLIGEADDRLTVVFSAGRRLAESVDPERREAVYETVHKILTRVCEGELNEQSAKLEKLLYGRRAA